MDFAKPTGTTDALVRAMQAKDRSSLLPLFTCDSVIVDSGYEHRADSIVEWISRLFQTWDSIQPINVRKLDGKSVVTLVLAKKRHEQSGDSLVAQFEWDISIAGGKISVLNVTRSDPPALPPPVASFVEATNTFDLRRLVDSFSDDAVVNDQLREYQGKSQIRNWAERDIIGLRLTMHVQQVVLRHENATVTASVDGEFDKRGLPDPLVLEFYFTVHHDKIVQLIILRNEPEV